MLWLADFIKHPAMEVEVPRPGDGGWVADAKVFSLEVRHVLAVDVVKLDRLIAAQAKDPNVIPTFGRSTKTVPVYRVALRFHQPALHKHPVLWTRWHMGPMWMKQRTDYSARLYDDTRNLHPHPKFIVELPEPKGTITTLTPFVSKHGLAEHVIWAESPDEASRWMIAVMGPSLTLRMHELLVRPSDDNNGGAVIELPE